jgi:hypothetical protein
MAGARLPALCRQTEQVIAAESIASQAQSGAPLCIVFIEGSVLGHGWKSWRTSDDM